MQQFACVLWINHKKHPVLIVFFKHMASLEMSLYWFVLRPKELQGYLNNEPAKAEVFQSYDLINRLHKYL